MALQKQTLALAFNQGMDTKTDPKQVLPGKLLYLKNSVFKTAQEINKRAGFDEIPNAILGGGSLSAGVNSGSYFNELTLLDGSNLYSYSLSTTDVVNKGPLVTTEISSTSIFRNSSTQYAADSAINGNFECFVWFDQLGQIPSLTENIRYSIIDKSTGQAIVSNMQIAVKGAQENVKVYSLGVYFVILRANYSAGTLTYYYINTATPTTLSGPVSVASNVSSPFMDGAVINGSLYFEYFDGTDTGIYSLSPTLVLSPKYTVAGAASNAASTLFGDVSGNVWVAYVDGTGGVKVFAVNGALTATILPITQTDTVLAVANNITGIVNGNKATIYVEDGSITFVATYDSVCNNSIRVSAVTLTGTVTTGIVLLRGMTLASKAFNYGGVYYFLGCFLTSLQTTYFVIDQAGLTVAKFDQDQAGGTVRGFIPKVNPLSSSSFQIAAIKKNSVTAFRTTLDPAIITNNLVYKLGVQSLTIGFTLKARPKWFLGNNLHYGGGLLSMYDGNNVVEHSYNMYPEGISGLINSTGGALGPGASTASINQVQYVGIYEWVDNQGQTHRSAPSDVLTRTVGVGTTITFTGNTTANSRNITSVSSTAGLLPGQVVSNTNFPAGSYITAVFGSTVSLNNTATASSTGSTFTTKDTVQITVNFPTLRLTQKKNVSLVLYRTTNNGTIFYRLSDPKSPTFNDKTVDYVQIVDSAGDAAIIANEQLYTTGGEAENIAAPAISALTSYRNRLAYLTPEDPYSWGYSKQVIEGVPVEFNPQLFTQSVDPKGGPLSGLAEMDDKLILFKKNLIFYVVGEGPTPSGLNNDYQNPQVISSDTGCVSQNSIVLTPIGLMFKSPKGIYLLARNLGVSYIGAEVEEYNDVEVTSSQLIQTLNQVRFNLSTGISLVYDYYFQQWSVFENINAADCTVFQDQFTYISPAGHIYQENPTVFTDAGSFVGIGLKTSWFSFAGVQGFERAYKLLLLGTYKSPHTLNVSVGYDFEVSQTPISPIVVNSDPGLYQFRVFLPRQKCESFQFEINESQESSFGQGLSLSSMAMEVGLKAGLNKLPAAKSYG